MLRHALRAALLPLVSYLGPAMAGILTGSLIVEQIFGLPGIGRYFVQGALNRDYTLVMGVVICYAALIIVLNFVADILYGVLDPRVRLDMSADRQQPRKAETLERRLRQGRSLWVDARAPAVPQPRRRRQHVVLALIALLAVFAPLLSPYAYDEINYDIVSCAPDWWPVASAPATPAARTGSAPTRWAATCSCACSMARGSRWRSALVATLVSLVIGVLYGATAGYLGGRVDELMMRFVDVLYSLPFIFFVIILMVMFDRNFILLFVAIGAVEWLTMARIVRGQTLSIKQKEFIEAARAAGVSPLRHHPPPHHSQRAGAGGGLCHPDRARRDPDRKLPVVPRPGHPGAADLLGRADLRRRQPMETAPWLLIFPGPVHGGDAVLLQLHRRRPARRARPEGSLMSGLLRNPRPRCALRHAGRRSPCRQECQASTSQKANAWAWWAKAARAKASSSWRRWALLAANGRATGSVQYRGEELLGLPPAAS